MADPDFPSPNQEEILLQSLLSIPAVLREELKNLNSSIQALGDKLSFDTQLERVYTGPGSQITPGAEIDFSKALSFDTASISDVFKNQFAKIDFEFLGDTVDTLTKRFTVASDEWKVRAEGETPDAVKDTKDFLNKSALIPFDLTDVSESFLAEITKALGLEIQTTEERQADPIGDTKKYLLDETGVDYSNIPLRTFLDELDRLGVEILSTSERIAKTPRDPVEDTKDYLMSSGRVSEDISNYSAEDLLQTLQMIGAELGTYPEIFDKMSQALDVAVAAAHRKDTPTSEFDFTAKTVNFFKVPEFKVEADRIDVEADEVNTDGDGGGGDDDGGDDEGGGGKNEGMNWMRLLGLGALLRGFNSALNKVEELQLATLSRGFIAPEEMNKQYDKRDFGLDIGLGVQTKALIAAMENGLEDNFSILGMFLTRSEMLGEDTKGLARSFRDMKTSFLLTSDQQQALAIELGRSAIAYKTSIDRLVKATADLARDLPLQAFTGQLNVLTGLSEIQARVSPRIDEARFKEVITPLLNADFKNMALESLLGIPRFQEGLAKTRTPQEAMEFVEFSMRTALQSDLASMLRDPTKTRTVQSNQMFLEAAKTLKGFEEIINALSKQVDETDKISANLEGVSKSLKNIQDNLQKPSQALAEQGADIAESIAGEAFPIVGTIGIIAQALTAAGATKFLFKGATGAAAGAAGAGGAGGAAAAAANAAGGVVGGLMGSIGSFLKSPLSFLPRLIPPVAIGTAAIGGIYGLYKLFSDNSKTQEEQVKSLVEQSKKADEANLLAGEGNDLLRRSLTRSEEQSTVVEFYDDPATKKWDMNQQIVAKIIMTQQDLTGLKLSLQDAKTMERVAEILALIDSKTSDMRQYLKEVNESSQRVLPNEPQSVRGTIGSPPPTRR